MTGFILYNPRWKDLRRVEKTLEEKPATWEKYEHEEGGKCKIFEMEIREFKEAKEKKEEGSIGKKEFYKAVKHVVAAGLDLMYSLRGEHEGRI